jgi:2,3-bisphosphoglycerate-independent phosphoglycerate mutase
MVGHSGNLEAAIKAVEVVDVCLGKIRQAMHDAGDTAWIITADHGNAETMIDPASGGPHTYHTTNPVPLALVSNDGPKNLQSGGALRDISPTILGILGVQEPIEMTGRDLRDFKP